MNEKSDPVKDNLLHLIVEIKNIKRGRAPNEKIICL
jgi:hypothetical protein